MVNIKVKLDTLKNDYPGFYKFFKDSIKNSQSRFKDYEDEKYKCYYYIGFYMLPSQKTEEYYGKLMSMKWEDRIKEEYKKVRVTITIVAGKFAISDQTKDITDTSKPYIDEIVKRKIYMEQTQSENPDNDILNSIPNLDDLKDRIESDMNDRNKLLEMLGIENTKNDNKNPKPQDLLRKLIENEKYEDAEKLIKEHPELKKRSDN